jgi:signal transduction histidine kinase
MKGAARPELQPNSDILWDGLMMDITELKGTQEALERSEAKLKQQATELTDLLHELQRTQLQLVQTEKMSSLGQLVAGIAHEINNPVSFIYGNLNYACEYIQDILDLLDLYKQHYPQPVPDIQAQSQTFDLEFVRQDLPKILSSMKVGTDRICQIVRSLRNFSRLDQTKVQTVDIHEMIDSTVLILQHRLKASGGKPAIDIIREYGDLPLVECYPGQLNQVFMNLIANAIDALEESFISQRAVLNGFHSKRSANQTIENPKSAFSSKSQGTSENAQIQIRTQVLEDNSHVLILIADNGPGISVEHQNEIFNAFFTTKPVGKGTGLGLSISYQIVVEKHQGLLKCFSEPGRGTEFWIQIPIMANG